MSDDLCKKLDQAEKKSGGSLRSDEPIRFENDDKLARGRLVSVLLSTLSLQMHQSQSLLH